MHNIKFDNPVFSPGINYTVRVGTKWARRLKPGQRVLLNKVAVAVVNRITVCHFSSIDPAAWTLNHDPECREMWDLYKKLEKIYGAFDPATVVTCIELNVLKDEKK